MKKYAIHFIVTALIIALTIGLPSAIYFKIFTPADEEAETGATYILPEKPSGEFVIMINEKRHPTSIDVWDDFFSERDYDPLSDKISCLTVSGDALGAELADRYSKRLFVKQMSIREENVILVLSKAELGLIDAVIMSADIADVYNLKTDVDGLRYVRVKGSQSEKT